MKQAERQKRHRENLKQRALQIEEQIRDAKSVVELDEIVGNLQMTRESNTDPDVKNLCTRLLDSAEIKRHFFKKPSVVLGIVDPKFTQETHQPRPKHNDSLVIPSRRSEKPRVHDEERPPTKVTHTEESHMVDFEDVEDVANEFISQHSATKKMEEYELSRKQFMAEFAQNATKAMKKIESIDSLEVLDKFHNELLKFLRSNSQRANDLDLLKMFEMFEHNIVKAFEEQAEHLRSSDRSIEDRSIEVGLIGDVISFLERKDITLADMTKLREEIHKKHPHLPRDIWIQINQAMRERLDQEKQPKQEQPKQDQPNFAGPQHTIDEILNSGKAVTVVMKNIYDFLLNYSGDKQEIVHALPELAEFIISLRTNKDPNTAHKKTIAVGQVNEEILQALRDLLPRDDSLSPAKDNDQHDTMNGILDGQVVNATDVNNALKAVKAYVTKHPNFYQKITDEQRAKLNQLYARANKANTQLRNVLPVIKKLIDGERPAPH